MEEDFLVELVVILDVDVEVVVVEGLLLDGLLVVLEDLVVVLRRVVVV